MSSTPPWSPAPCRNLCSQPGAARPLASHSEPAAVTWRLVTGQVALCSHLKTPSGCAFLYCFPFIYLSERQA